ncbi:MAG: hypothetical protein ACHREM_31000, partial [Polyangiales bacterium]
TESRASSTDEGPEAATVDAFMTPLVAAVGDLGDVSSSVDVTDTALVLEAHLKATGLLSSWFSHYPGGSPHSLLTLPKAHDAVLIRLPESIREVLASAPKDDKKSATPPTPGVREAMALGGALGNEIAIVWDGDWSGTGEGTPTSGEVLVRIDLADSEAARTAIRALSAQLLADGEKNRGVSRYAKYGAEGETITQPSPLGDTVMQWAVRAPHFYIDVAVGRAPTLLEAATEPGGKRLYRTDARVAGVLEKFPKDGLAFAFFGLGEATSSDPEATLRWGWLSATKAGLAVRVSVPLSLLHDAIATAFTSASAEAKPEAE